MIVTKIKERRNIKIRSIIYCYIMDKSHKIYSKLRELGYDVQPNVLTHIEEIVEEQNEITFSTLELHVILQAIDARLELIKQQDTSRFPRKPQTGWAALAERLKHKLNQHLLLSEKVKCQCPCHQDNSIKHVQPCCEDGFISL